jgi:hypothetical protein
MDNNSNKSGKKEKRKRSWLRRTFAEQTMPISGIVGPG